MFCKDTSAASNLNYWTSTDEYVLRFHVSMDDTVGMQIMQSSYLQDWMAEILNEKDNIIITGTKKY